MKIDTFFDATCGSGEGTLVLTWQLRGKNTRIGVAVGHEEDKSGDIPSSDFAPLKTGATAWDFGLRNE